MTKERGSLGRGLAAILGSTNSADFRNTSKIKNIYNGSDTLVNALEIPISKIVVNPFQPRVEFDTEKLNELATSIEQLGIIQPITVRKLNENEFQLISGERRLRASLIVGYETIPAYIKVANDKEMLEMALVENIQREDLDPIEIALSYRRLIKEIPLTQQQCSERVGKNRSTITNFIRLLKLPKLIQDGLRKNKISTGHARALLTIIRNESQINLYHDIVQNGYSVREVEQLSKEFAYKKYNRTSRIKKNTTPIPFLQQKMVHDLSNNINASVELKQNAKGKGKLMISFKNEKELERIIKTITK